MLVTQHFLGDVQRLGIRFQRLVIIGRTEIGHANVVNILGENRMTLSKHLLADAECTVEILQSTGMVTHGIVYRSDITIGVGYIGMVCIQFVL